MGKLSKLLVGALVIYAGACLFKGLAALLASLISFVVISIMCTGGIALVVWVPLAIVIVGAMIALGSVVLGLLVWCFRGGSNERRKEENASESRESVPTPPVKEPDREQIAIERYIDRAKFYGLSREQILSALRNGGWSDAEIQMAYGGYQSP